MARLLKGSRTISEGVSQTELDEFVGSTNIATLGTVGTGTWEGTDVGVAHGGTGASTLTDGGVLLGSGTGAITATAVLADGEMLVGDASGDPAIESGATLRTSIGLGNVNNTADASQTSVGTITSGTWEGTDVGVAHGGTGASTLTANYVLLGNGTSAPQMIAPGSDGNVLTSTGSTWQSEAGGGGGTTSNYADDGWHVTMEADAAYTEADIKWPGTAHHTGGNVTYSSSDGSIEVDTAGTYLVMSIFGKETSTQHFNFHLMYKTAGGSFANTDDGRTYAIGSRAENYYRTTGTYIIVMAAGSFLKFKGDGYFDGSSVITTWQGIRIL